MLMYTRQDFASVDTLFFPIRTLWLVLNNPIIYSNNNVIRIFLKIGNIMGRLDSLDIIPQK